jgi:hypothetical protein
MSRKEAGWLRQTGRRLECIDRNCSTSAKILALQTCPKKHNGEFFENNYNDLD